MGIIRLYRLVSSSLLLFAVLHTQCLAKETLRSTTLSTLPAAIPKSNDSDLCAFTDRNSLIDRVDSDWREYNVSLLVEQCESVCILLYGAGNPDISGIGAMISYTIQGLSTLILGPVLSSLIFTYNQGPSTTSEDTFFQFTPPTWLAPLVLLAQHHHQANIIVGVSVLVASIIRITQVAPVAEVSFIYILGSYEFFITVISFVSMHSIFNPGAHGSWHVFFSYLHALFLLSGFMAILFMKKFPSSKSEVLGVIMDYCISERDYPIPYIVTHAPHGVNFYLVFWPSYIVGIILLLLLASYFRLPLSRFNAWLRKYYRRICQWLHVRPRRFAAIVAVTGIVGNITACCGLLLLLLQQQREALRSASGSAYQDSEWGFGQVAAVLLWLPLLEETIVSVMEGIRAYSGPRRVPSQAEGSTTDQAPGDIPVGDIAPERHMGGEALRNTKTAQGDGDRDLVVAAGSDVPPSLLTQKQASAITRTTPTDIVEQDVRRRATWPRNADGTYLPTNTSQSARI